MSLVRSEVFQLEEHDVAFVATERTLLPTEIEMALSDTHLFEKAGLLHVKSDDTSERFNDSEAMALLSRKKNRAHLLLAVHAIREIGCHFDVLAPHREIADAVRGLIME